MTILAPADVEAVMVTLLADPVSTTVPNPRPSSLTRVTRVGGDDLNLVQSRPRVLVECWGPDSVAAFERAATAWAAVRAAKRTTVAGVWIADVGLTEPVNFPDPDTDSPRYQFVAQLTTSMQEIP